VSYEDPNGAKGAVDWFNGKPFEGKGDTMMTVTIAQRKANPMYANGGGGGGGYRGGGGNNMTHHSCASCLLRLLLVLSPLRSALHYSLALQSIGQS
jgi:hypothetical protein